MVEPPQGPSGWADYLKKNWETRARSASTDYFVAPQGFGNDERWNEHGRQHAEGSLLGLDREWLQRQHMLELGCGVGRLAQFFAQHLTSYTGIDIAPGMLEKARTRCADAANTRFFETDGLTVPTEARDRQYGLIMSIAVLIHCPKPVIESLVSDAYGLLEPGGVLRIQVYGDTNDLEGLQQIPLEGQSQSATAEVPESESGVESDVEPPAAAATKEQNALMDEYYMGYPFRYAEFRNFILELLGTDGDLYRDEPSCIYATIQKPV